MIETLQAFIENIKNDKRLSSFSEDQTKMAIILPILRRIGWDTENIDEVFPEFSVENRRVDYALRLNNKSVVFLEAKRPTEDLDSGNHQEQLLDYSFRQGIELALLTNGITWFLYLPNAGGDWKARKFYTIDLKEQESASVTSKFIELLSKKNIESGKAIQTAKAVHKDKLKNGAIQEALPVAWNRIMEEPDSLLVDLLVESAEKICGYKPEASSVSKFLKENENQILITLINQPVEPQRGKIAPKKVEQSNSKIPKKLGRKGFQNLEDYLIPVIKLIKGGYDHKKAFQEVADKLNVEYSTVASQCTRGLKISLNDFVERVESGRIRTLLRAKYRDKTNLIDQEIG